MRFGPSFQLLLKALWKGFCFQGSDRRILQPERIYSDSVQVATAHPTAARGHLHRRDACSKIFKNEMGLWQQTDFYNVRKSQAFCCFSKAGLRPVLSQSPACFLSFTSTTLLLLSQIWLNSPAPDLHLNPVLTST